MLFQLAYSLNGHPVRLLGPLLVGPALSYLWPHCCRSCQALVQLLIRIISIYEGLNPVLNESYQYYHQYAKCHLWGMASHGYEDAELEEARVAALTALNMITNEMNSSVTLGHQIAHAHILNTLTIIYTKLCFIEEFKNPTILEDTIDYFYLAVNCQENYGAMRQAKYANRTAKEEEGGVLKRWITHIMVEKEQVSSENSKKLNAIVMFWKNL